MKFKETLIAFVLIAAVLTGTGAAARRVIRGSSWFEQNVSTCTDAAGVWAALGVTNGTTANWTGSSLTNSALPGVANAWGAFLGNGATSNTTGRVVVSAFPTAGSPSLEMLASYSTINGGSGDGGTNFVDFTSYGDDPAKAHHTTVRFATIMEHNEWPYGGFGIFTGGDRASCPYPLTQAVAWDSSGNQTTRGSVATGAPSGGTAAAWKLGSLVTGASVSLVTTNYIQVDIGGTLYKLAIVQ